jgi:hypothetical protein
MKHASETVPALWDAYSKALEAAKSACQELDRAAAVERAPGTIEALERLRPHQAAARAAVDDWRQSAADLYRAAGLSAP